jgi:SAM-dependent methyltransferase
MESIIEKERLVFKEGVYSMNKSGLQEKVRQTSDQFTLEFSDIPDRADRSAKQAEDITLFLYKTGIDPDFTRKNKKLNHDILQSVNSLDYTGDFSFLNDKIVVDGGCGNGRFAEIVAPHCKQLICLDIGEHIFLAKERLKNYSNVTFVQCDLADIPVATDSVDYVYSIGVIHHTPNPGKSLKELARLLKPSAKISVWVYPPAYWGPLPKKIVSKSIRSLLLRKSLESQVRFIRKYLMPIGKLQLKIQKLGLRYLLAPLFIINVPRHEDENEMLSTTIDYYLPQYINTYTNSQLKELFLKANLSFKELPFPTSATGEKKA